MDPCKEHEPQVIDHEMITRCLDEQGLKGELGRLAREEGIPWGEVSHIRLEFMHILRIDHLWVLPGLTMLSLNNNLIENIENLNTLVNLTELDLSFNKITKIENLSELVHLEILNLFDNQIVVLENMDNLTQLTIFSIGNNLIDNRKNVLYLRRFNKLKSVNLAGNPCAENYDFRMFVATFLPKIVYYEYKLIEASERDCGKELYAKDILNLEEEECVMREQQEKMESEKAEAELHADSFVEFLGTNHLFEQMFEKDFDGLTLLKVDEEAKQYYAEYEVQFVDLTTQIFKHGQEQLAIRKSEVEQFFKVTEGAKLKNQQESIDFMETFVTIKSEIFKKIHNDKDLFTKGEITRQLYNQNLEDYREIYFKAIHETWKTLMGLEVTLFEQIEETNQNFEQALTEMINNFIEMAQGYFAQIRSCQGTYTELISEMATRYLTTMTLSSTEIPPEFAALFVDRDTLMNALAVSHDLHFLVIDNREDQLVRKARTWLSNLVNDLQKDEIKRNRAKVLEINHYLDIQKEEFEMTAILPELVTEML